MLENSTKFRVALLSGTIIGVVSGLPGVNLINCCCCAGVILGGFLSVYFYRQEHAEGMPPIEPSDALILGVMAGVAGAFIATIVGVLVHLLFGSVQEELLRSIIERLLERLEESGGFTSDMIEQMRQEFDQSIRDSGKISGILGGLFISLVVYPLFSILGALIGYSVFKPKKASELPLTR